MQVHFAFLTYAEYFLDLCPAKNVEFSSKRCFLALFDAEKDADVVSVIMDLDF